MRVVEITVTEETETETDTAWALVEDRTWYGRKYLCDYIRDGGSCWYSKGKHVHISIQRLLEDAERAKRA